jgi:glycosyltransferase involved in cell wall biosynthesis
MKKLKILWLHSHLTLPGGGTYYILEVMRELSKNNSIKLYVQKSTREFEQLFKSAGIDVSTLSKYSTGDILFWLNFSRQIKKEISVLKREVKNSDLVISSMFPMNIIANSLPLPHLQLCLQPFAFFWDPLMIKKLSISKRIFLYFLRSKFGRLDIDSTKQSQAILTINEGSKQSILEVYNRDAVPTFMGVNVDKVNTEELARKYVGKKIILHTTDWTPLKKTPWLIEQFLLIQKKYPDVLLLITEIDTRLKSAELNKIRIHKIKNVEFLGTLPTDLLHQYFALADIVVYAGFGTAITTSLFVLECMAYGTPPIVSQGASEDVEHGKTGLVFNTDIEFRECLLLLLSNEALRLDFAKNASKYVMQKHSWANVAKVFQAEILKLADKG